MMLKNFGMNKTSRGNYVTVMLMVANKRSRASDLNTEPGAERLHSSYTTVGVQSHTLLQAFILVRIVVVLSSVLI
jgi:hypothetical protein